MPTWLTLLLLLAAFAAYNVLSNRVWPGHNLPLAAAFVGVLLLIAWLADLSLADLGLAPDTWRAGLRWGAVCVGLVVVGYAVMLAVPALRSILHQNTPGSTGHAVLESVVLIPLATVVPEELAFRGVLWAVLQREHGPAWATVVSSLLFGVWHVLPALAGGAANQAAGEVVGTGGLGTALRVAGTILFTAAAGVLLCELRRRSGSLLTPILLHWGVNGIGVLAVRVA